MAVRDKKRIILMDAILNEEKKMRVQRGTHKLNRVLGIPRSICFWLLDHLGWLIPSFIVTVAAYVFVNALNGGSLSFSYMWRRVTEMLRQVIG